MFIAISCERGFLTSAIAAAMCDVFAVCGYAGSSFEKPSKIASKTAENGSIYPV